MFVLLWRAVGYERGVHDEAAGAKLTQKEMIIHAAPKAEAIDTRRITELRMWICFVEPWAASASTIFKDECGVRWKGSALFPSRTEIIAYRYIQNPRIRSSCPNTHSDMQPSFERKIIPDTSSVPMHFSSPQNETWQRDIERTFRECGFCYYCMRL